jgi:hypothetical protein
VVAGLCRPGKPVCCYRGACRAVRLAAAGCLNTCTLRLPTAAHAQSSHTATTMSWWPPRVHTCEGCSPPSSTTRGAAARATQAAAHTTATAACLPPTPPTAAHLISTAVAGHTGAPCSPRRHRHHALHCCCSPQAAQVCMGYHCTHHCLAVCVCGNTVSDPRQSPPATSQHITTPTTHVH